jgi:hypothetical protein
MSSTAPGTTVEVSAAALPGASAQSTGAFFAVGLTQRGPVGVPIILTSLQDYVNLCGTRQTYSPLYDCADLFFSSGGAQMYVSRIVGPAATTSTVSLSDRGSTPQPTLQVQSNGPGVAGNSLTVSVIAGPVAGTYVIQISMSGLVVETSPPLQTTSDAVNWGQLIPVSVNSPSSKYVTITDLASTNPAPEDQPALISNVALSGGADDNTDAGDTQYEAGLLVFTPAMGPGQVACPGRTTTAVYTALLNFALATNRVALLDAVNGASAATIVTAATACQESATDPSYGTMCAPWITWPGIPTGTVVPAWPRQIPPSAATATVMAVNDASNDCNIAAGGNNGILSQALGVVQNFVDSDRAALNAAGVSVWRAVYGNVTLYGYESLATDPRWTDLANVRFRMELINDGQVIGNSFVFSQIDGQGKIFTAFNGALSARLATYYASGSLFGATPAQAYSVNTGPNVNTPQTITARQLNAIESVVMSPSADAVNINITKYLADQSLNT